MFDPFSNPLTGKTLADLFVKPKVFVSYHHGGDQAYYDELSWRHHDHHQIISDNSLERAFDSDDSEYVRRRIREKHLTGTSCTIVLIGRNTHGRKYVDWEIKSTLDKGHGLIGVILPTTHLAPTFPARLWDNVQSGYALYTSWQDFLDPTRCRATIADARSRSVRLIKNDRDMRRQNAPLVY